MAKADWKRGLVWLPAAIGHNEPESPNVVVSWRSAWQELPECEIKSEAHKQLTTWAEAKGQAWVVALGKATAKPYLEPSPKAIDKPTPNQEQEQEQEQKQEQKQTGQPSAEDRFSMHPNWQPSADVVASFGVAMIPNWGYEPLVARHRTHFVSTPGEKRTDAEWNQSCSRWVFGDWNNAKKRPKKPDDSEVIEIR